MVHAWTAPKLEREASQASRAVADATCIYLQSILAVRTAVAASLEQPGIELLPARLAEEDGFIVNPLFHVSRFRDAGAQVMQAPDGAVLQFSRADFFAEDIPADAALFRFHDGQCPRHLLCTETFASLAAKNRWSGFKFHQVGLALSDA